MTMPSASPEITESEQELILLSWSNLCKLAIIISFLTEILKQILVTFLCNQKFFFYKDNFLITQAWI